MSRTPVYPVVRLCKHGLNAATASNLPRIEQLRICGVETGSSLLELEDNRLAFDQPLTRTFFIYSLLISPRRLLRSQMPSRVSLEQTGA